MSGFKKFVMQGNLVELAVAFVIAAAFGAIVKAFVTVIMDIIGKAGGTPNFSAWNPRDVHVGLFLTELVAFVILAAIVYFFVVKPYERAKERFGAPVEEAAAPADVVLLMEIRDALQARN